MIGNRCQNCTWWDERPAPENTAPPPAGAGYCRKHYPIIALREGRYYGNWPLVGANDLCGEFRPEKEQS